MNMFSIAAAVASFAIHDFTPDFWRFWDAAQNQPVEQQVQLWQQLNVAPHQAVFDDLATPCKDQWNADWSRSNFFPDLPRVIPAIRSIVAGLGQQLEQANTRFLKMFPDMRWSGDIYVMASGYCFSGRAQTIEGRSALLFGVDAMAALGMKDLIPGMQHELFHRYHSQFFEFEVSSAYPLWTRLWTEGMAMHVSKQLDPSASELDLGLVPLGMAQQASSRRLSTRRAGRARAVETAFDPDAGALVAGGGEAAGPRSDREDQRKSQSVVARGKQRLTARPCSQSRPAIAITATFKRHSRA